ncbi:hypothetical protein HMPREF1550_01971 [Actinomyces sp. oral taxon 877 str. F0543]|nr:hypothetical protein HMPREF1550_01971 [Actinomyces sp. oral taxon 877 str. F0543]
MSLNASGAGRVLPGPLWPIWRPVGAGRALVARAVGARPRTDAPWACSGSDRRRGIPARYGPWWRACALLGT